MKSVHEVNILDIFKDKKEESVLLGGIYFVITLALLIIFLLLGGAQKCFADEVGTASWYTLESTLKEGCSGICADGKEMSDGLNCAMWGVPLGSYVLVTNLENGKSVRVKVRDRGPSRRLVKKGRVLDLSREAFSRIADLKRGIIPVKIESL